MSSSCVGLYRAYRAVRLLAVLAYEYFGNEPSDAAVETL